MLEILLGMQLLTIIESLYVHVLRVAATNMRVMGWPLFQRIMLKYSELLKKNFERLPIHKNIDHFFYKQIITITFILKQFGELPKFMLSKINYLSNR